MINFNMYETNSIPMSAYIERDFPVEKISTLAVKEGNSKRPIYQLHKWWARRLSSIVRSLIIGSVIPEDAKESDFWKRFYGNNDLSGLTVMDMFMGGGSTLIEAKKMGAKTIGVDVYPLACFIVSKELQSVNIEVLKKSFDTLRKKVYPKIASFYMTRINGKLRPVINFFWVYEVQCPCCGSRMQAHPHYKVYENKCEKGVVCRLCGELHVVPSDSETLKCVKCGCVTEIDKGVVHRGKCRCECGNEFFVKDAVDGRESLRLFAVEYEDENGERAYKSVDDFDLTLFQEASAAFDRIADTLPLPTEKIPTGNPNDKRPMSHGYRRYTDLFTKRQLYGLGILLKEILKIEDRVVREWMLIVFSDSLASNNILCSYAYGYRKLTPLFGIHAYTVPLRPVEGNVWGSGNLGRGSFEKTFKKSLRAKEYCRRPYETKIVAGKTKKIHTDERISSEVTFNPNSFYGGRADTLILNRSAESLDGVRNKSIDLILTDPPYYDNLNYSHLADFYYQWLKKYLRLGSNDTIQKSLFVAKDGEESLNAFSQGLAKIFSEAGKKLKDDGLMVFSYHHNKANAWKAVGIALKESGFIVSNIFPVRSEGQSAYHSAAQTIKWDTIIVARKSSFAQVPQPASIEDLVQMWEKRLEKIPIAMNESDKLSFYRSLAVMRYVNTGSASLEKEFNKARRLAAS